MRLLGSRVLPHDTVKTTCPPAALVSGTGPTILVPSLMRSGTHLLLDALFNNFPALRRRPLFVDFDAYERAKLPVAPLRTLSGVIIKTHFPETCLAETYIPALKELAGSTLVLTPRRPVTEVRKSLAKWGQHFSVEEFAEIETRFIAFWKPYAPVFVDFSALLDPVKIESVIGLISQRTGLEPARKTPVMPRRHRVGVYFDKMLTRAFGARAPRINTTIGFKLRATRL